MTASGVKTIAAILAKHYGLAEVSRTEVKDEIRSLARKTEKMTLDDRGLHLASRIHVATGRDVVELFKGE